MAKVEIVMPKMGESIIEATVLKWLKSVGDPVEMDEPIMEIATDKVDSEVPSPVDGKILETRFNEGDVVPVGEIIAILETESAGGGDENSSSNGHNVKTPNPEKVAVVAAAVSQPVLETVSAAPMTKPSGDRFYSPLVLNIARQEGISMTQLESLPGTGREGRVTKKDILAFVKSPQTGNGPELVQKTAGKSVAPVVAQQVVGGMPVKTYSHSGEYEIQEMDRMRKMIAENMVYSKHVSAHVTSFVEADVTTIVNWRNKVKAAFQDKYGQKLTYTPIFAEAIVRALQEHPMVNISLDGNNILVKKDINIGIAVALPTDNLIVPVIKNAERMNLLGLAASVNDLADRARRGKLKPDELEGGTYTISNVGTFGNVMGTPIIMQPQVAIMAMGAIRKKPAVIETPEGDFIGIRQMMFLSHSYDHRIVDGALGGRFVKRVAEILEAWDPDREI